MAHIDEALSSGNVEEVVHTLGFACTRCRQVQERNQCFYRCISRFKVAATLGLSLHVIVCSFMHVHQQILTIKKCRPS